MCDGDQGCIELCLDGHPEAFRGLVGRHEGRLVAYLAGRFNDVERAEHVAQESFVRAFFSLGKLKKRESFFPWLLGIANRVAKEQQRLARRSADERHYRVLASQTKDRDAGREVTEDHDLQRALAELPDSYREVILLRYYAGLSCAQVAEQLGIPLGTVTKKLSRAYAMLREALRPDGRWKGHEVKP